MVRLHGPRATNTWKLVKIGPFPSPRYTDMEYIGITKFFFGAILYAGHIRTLLFIHGPFLLHPRYSCFSHLASRLYRYLWRNPLFDSPMEKGLWSFPHFIKLLCKRRSKDTFVLGWRYPTACGWRPWLGPWLPGRLGGEYGFPPYAG